MQIAVPLVNCSSSGLPAKRKPTEQLSTLQG